MQLCEVHVSIGGPLSYPLSSRGGIEGERAGQVLGGGGAEGGMRGIGLRAARHLGCWNHMTIHLNERERKHKFYLCICKGKHPSITYMYITVHIMCPYMYMNMRRKLLGYAVFVG